MANLSITEQMPDTLNLTDRAELSFNAMISVADDEGIPFFSGFLQSDKNHPAWMINKAQWIAFLFLGHSFTVPRHYTFASYKAPPICPVFA